MGLESIRPQQKRRVLPSSCFLRWGSTAEWVAPRVALGVTGLSEVGVSRLPTLPSVPGEAPAPCFTEYSVMDAAALLELDRPTGDAFTERTHIVVVQVTRSLTVIAHNCISASVISPYRHPLLGIELSAKSKRNSKKKRHGFLWYVKAILAWFLCGAGNFITI